MRINKGDRTILIILIILLAGYVAYASLRRPSSQSTPIPQPLYTTSAQDSTTQTDSAAQDGMHQKDSSVTTFIKTDRYPGPPERQQWSGETKLTAGATIDLNTADTILLQRVPGIGPSYARRIAKYRDMLGGYYAVEQLQEVYGMERERYNQIAPYFTLRTPVRPLIATQDSIPYHPYLQWRHKKVLKDLLRKGAPFTWRDLMKSSAFTPDDSLRLAPYLRLEEKSAEINPTP